MSNKRRACLYIPSATRGTKNYPFTVQLEGEGFKNLLFPYPYLKRILDQMDIDLSTRDINSPEDSFLTFCLDEPQTLTARKRPGQVWCLIINDPPVYNWQAWDRRFHENFDFVFTYDETLVDGKKYFYYPIAQDTEYFSVPDVVSAEDFENRRLATNVSNAIQRQQDPKFPDCTHHLRYATIKWYGRNHPDDFRFYGGTFLRRDYYFSFRGLGLVKKFVPTGMFSRIARSAQRDLVRVFGGELTPLGKFDVIKQFRFYYCYENTFGINGYLTEKIFDCLYSGVVPIYWGAPNIKELIPYECFIDGRDFRSQEDLYSFIKNMNYATYRAYLNNARKFLQSAEMERFTIESSIGHVLRPILERLPALKLSRL